MAVIVILALVALFIGLRLYSVLGERTGHEQQQPILKPAESDARVEARPAASSCANPWQAASISALKFSKERSVVSVAS